MPRTTIHNVTNVTVETETYTHFNTITVTATDAKGFEMSFELFTNDRELQVKDITAGETA
jgi:hypothetical protein|tara:strand:+ start:998 stop:1177 length:180 start_codon:yes stop_codon:yes gene_type:complete